MDDLEALLVAYLNDPSNCSATEAYGQIKDISIKVNGESYWSVVCHYAGRNYSDPIHVTSGDLLGWMWRQFSAKPKAIAHGGEQNELQARLKSAYEEGQFMSTFDEWVVNMFQNPRPLTNQFGKKRAAEILVDIKDSAQVNAFLLVSS